jgi:hypothetical protein
MTRPYSHHVKQSGFFTDNLGAFTGTLLGAGGTAAGLYYGNNGNVPGRLPVLGGMLGAALGGLVDIARMRKKLENQDMSSYRMSVQELKELGLSKAEIDDILKHPLHTQKMPKSAHVKSALEVKDKENAIFRPLSSTVGRLSSIGLGHMLDVPTHTASLEDEGIKRHLDSIKDHPALKDVGVHLGSMRLWDRLARTWKNDRTDFLDKLHSTVTLPLTSLGASLSRADHFDPMSNTVTVYHGAPSILAHELGHALDYNTAKDVDTWRRLYFNKSPVNQEYLASNLAMNRLTADLLADKKRSKDPKAVKELSDQAKQLRKALDTYRQVHGDDMAMRRMAHRDSETPGDLEFLVTNPSTLKKIRALLKKHKIHTDV